MQRSGKPILVIAVIFTNARIWANGCKWSQRWKTYFPRWSTVSLATYSRSWNKLQGMKFDNAGLTINAFFLLNYLLKCQLHCHPWAKMVFLKMHFNGQFWYIKIHTWLQGSGVIKQKKSSWGSIINNTFLLFYSPKPCSQVWILIYQKWSISSLWQSSYIYFILGDPIKKIRLIVGQLFY